MDLVACKSSTLSPRSSMGSYNSDLSSHVKTGTMIQRQMMHPLEREDPIAYKFIQFVRLGYLEDEAPTPIPRHQGLPEDAFGKLTGRSILVSLSHGWFFQNHPDPRGRKLDLIRNVFAPSLRERYPHTSIVVFFDFLATPQRPRTEDEDERFRIAMERMNSVYVFLCFNYVTQITRRTSLASLTHITRKTTGKSTLECRL